MKIQYCSDLHLEFPHNREFIKNHPIIPVGEILVLAGDILPFTQLHEHKDFLDLLSSSFEKVFWIPGNHEYYGSDINNRSSSFCEKIHANLFLVNNYEQKIKDVNFIFSTLWSKISVEHQFIIQNTLSDFTAIRDQGGNLKIQKFNDLHDACFEFISRTVKKNENEKNVVISHHVPTFMNYPEQHATSKVNQGFATELFEFIHASNIDYWLYGHHHTNTPDFTINSTQLITNQLGYVKYKKNKTYKNNAFFEI